MDFLTTNCLVYFTDLLSNTLLLLKPNKQLTKQDLPSLSPSQEKGYFTLVTISSDEESNLTSSN